MKIIELVEFVSSSKNKMLKGAQLEELVSKKIETKKYLSIKEKKGLVESIINECILFHDGVFQFDDVEKYICFTMRAIEAYTNLELSNDMEDDYDLLCESGLLNIVIDTFNVEYENVKVLLQMKCDDILNENNIEIQIGKFLNGLSNKIDDVINIMSNKIDGFSFDKLPIEASNLNKLIEFVNKNK